MINKVKLHNGLSIVSYYDPNAKTVTLSFTVNVGSHSEKEDNYGIAHFTEHMLFKGTTHMNSQQISESIEGIGGILNAETTFEYTRYYCTVPAECWEDGLNVLFDMLVFNTIPEEEFECEKQVVLEELKMYDDEASSKIFDLLFKQLHPNYLNRQLIGGTVESVSKITRQQMLDFIEKYYTFNNITLIATGNIEHTKLTETLNKITENIELRISNLDKETSTFQPDKLGQKDLIEKKEIAQSHLSWGIFGPKPTEQDYATGEVISTLLGGNSSSRLYQIIREKKGLAYSVSMDIEPFTDTSIFCGYVGLDGNNIKGVKKVILEELNKLKTTLVDENELKRVKAYIKGTTLIGQETTSGKASFINNAITTGVDTDIEKFLESVDLVTNEAIKNFAEKYFTDDNICFVQIIPK